MLSRLTGPVRGFRIGKSPRLNEIFQVPIESLDKHGYGLVTIEWDTMQKQLAPTKLRVRGALPGETVRFRVVSIFSTGSAVHTVRMSLFGRREHLIRPQKDGQEWRSSVEPALLPVDHEESKYLVDSSSVCPHFDRRHDEQSCAGCTVPHMQYTRQVIEKTKKLKKALSGAVDSKLLESVSVVPKSKLENFASFHEMHAFSARPLGVPLWGQPSFQPVLPGERRKKHFVATPECKLIPKSARAMMSRFSDLVAVAHETQPKFFSVFDDRLNEGFLRSVIVQSNSEHQHFISIVTARPIIERFVQSLKQQVTSRLMDEFKGQIVGIQVVQAKEDLSRDKEFFARGGIVVEGESNKVLLGLSSGMKIPISLGSSRLLDSELADSIVSELVECLGTEDVFEEPDGIMELYGGQGELSGVLGEMARKFIAVREARVEKLIHEETGLMLPVGDSDGLVTVKKAEEQSVDLLSPNHFPPQDEVLLTNTPEKIKKLTPNFKGTAVVNFPPQNGKDEIKGATSKQFRHWLTSSLRPKRVVYITEQFEGLRKDIGHLSLMGYELKHIKAFDGQPGRMDKIVVFAVLERRPTYEPLKLEQLIE